MKGEKTMKTSPIRLVTITIIVAMLIISISALSVSAALNNPTITVSNSSGTTQNSYLTSDSVYARIAANGNGQKDIRVYVVTIVPSDGQALSDFRGSYTSATITSTSKTMQVWAAPLGEGTYFLVLDWGANGIYSSSTDKISSSFSVTAVTFDTSLRVECTPTAVDTSGVMQTTITGCLTLSDACTGVAGKTISLSYYDGSQYNSIGSATTSINGIYSLVWNVPIDLPNGLYIVRAEFSGDSEYEFSEGFTNGDTGLLVLPEYSYGALVALVACFGALIVFKKRTSLQKSSTN